MSDDIEFSVGLDTSSAEEKLNRFEQRVRQDASKSIPYQGTPQPAVFTPSGDNAWDRMRLTQERNLARRQASAGWRALNSPTLPEAERRMVELQASQRSKDAETFDGLLKGLREKNKLTEQQGIKQEEITEESKAQNREYNEHPVKLGRTLKSLAAILGLVQAIRKAWGLIWDKTINRNSEFNKTIGFLSQDPTGAFNANWDRERGMVYSGIANMKNDAYFSVGAYDALATKLQTAKENAMAGRGVDDDFATAIQQLNSWFGTNYNAEQLLVGDPNRSITEIENELITAISNGIPQLSKMGQVQQSQAMAYLRTVFGDEIMNGIMVHANKRAKGEVTEGLVEQLLRFGSSSVSATRASDEATKLAESMALLRNSLESLTTRFLEKFGPAIANVIQWLQTFIDTLPVFSSGKKRTTETRGADILHSTIRNRNPITWFGADRTKFDSMLNSNNWVDNIGLLGLRAKTQDENSFINNKINNALDYGVMSQNALKTLASGDDLINSFFWADPDINSGRTHQKVEYIKSREMLSSFFNSYKRGTPYSHELGNRLGQLDFSMFNTEKEFFDFVYTGDKSKDKNLRELWKKMTGIMQFYFKENTSLDVRQSGIDSLDITPEDSMNYAGYLKKGMSGEDYYWFLKGLAPQIAKYDNRYRSVDVLDPVDYNKNGVIDFDEIRIKVVLEDSASGREIYVGNEKASARLKSDMSVR